MFEVTGWVGRVAKLEYCHGSIWYDGDMRRGTEGKFQDTLLKILRSQGLSCQKFNDLYSEGIPDIYIRFPENVHHSAWIEIKALSEWPKRETSKLPPRFRPTEAQTRWMNAFSSQYTPCWVIVNTPHGWFAMDHSHIEKIWNIPVCELKKYLEKDPPTIGRIIRSVYEG